MTRQTPTIQWGRRLGASLSVGDLQITPESFVVLVLLGPLSFVWNWPVGISVVRGTEVRRVLIVDVTRIVVWFCWAIALAAGIVGLAASLRREKNEVNP